MFYKIFFLIYLYYCLQKKTVVHGVVQNTSELEDFFWWCLGMEFSTFNLTIVWYLVYRNVEQTLKCV